MSKKHVSCNMCKNKRQQRRVISVKTESTAILRSLKEKEISWKKRLAICNFALRTEIVILNIS